ncbi:MAG: hypothetical protein ACPLRX_00110 [Candidatus Saccharicenans sp.]
MLTSSKPCQMSLIFLIFLTFGATFLAGQEKISGQQVDQSEVSAANLQAAREKAEYYDRQGDYTKALQYYLECIRQADGLKKKEAAAWARNNAAYMLIKQHWKDPTADLRPAKQLLEEALAMEDISAECRQKLQSNLQYVSKIVRD